MGSKRWTWVLNLLKSFGSQILDLGLDSNKVMKASRVELGLQFKQKSCKPQALDLSFHSCKVGLKFKEGHVSLKP
jgi:hypothetical protein